jgi:hypothetical protein
MGDFQPDLFLNLSGHSYLFLGLVWRTRCVTAPIFANNAAKRLEQFGDGKALQISAYSRFAAKPSLFRHRAASGPNWDGAPGCASGRFLQKYWIARLARSPIAAAVATAATAAIAAAATATVSATAAAARGPRFAWTRFVHR